MATWSPERKARALELADAGTKYDEICKKLVKEFKVPVQPEALAKQIRKLRADALVASKVAESGEVSVEARPSMRGKGFSWSQAEDTALRELLAVGTSWEAAATELSLKFGMNRTPSSIANRRNRLLHNGKSWTDEQVERAFGLLAAGHSYVQTAKKLSDEFGISRNVNALRLKLYKVRARTKKNAVKKKSAAIELASASFALPVSLAATLPKESPRKNGIVTVPDGRSISVDYPTGQVRIVLHGELPVSAIRGLAEVLVAAAVS